MNDFRNSRDSRPRPVYRDRRSQPGRPRTAPKKNLFANKAPEGSEQWLKPWVELKYFTYNPAVFPRMLGSVSGEIAPGSLVNVYDKNGELFGAGFWNEASRTPLRMVHHGKDAFAERDLDAALERAVSCAGKFCAWMKPLMRTACCTEIPTAWAAWWWTVTRTC